MAGVVYPKVGPWRDRFALIRIPSKAAHEICAFIKNRRAAGSGDFRGRSRSYSFDAGCGRRKNLDCPKIAWKTSGFRWNLND
jgi:hypothetical protein